MKTVYTFDFDGTLTTRDTLIEFIRFAHGTLRMLWGFLLYSPLLVLMKLRLIDNGRMKERMFAYFFKGWSLRQFNDCCQRFAHEQRNQLLRQKGMELVRKALADGANVLIVSASIDNWVKPFFSNLAEGSVRMLGTQIETRNGVVTGRFLTANCYGAEKVRRIQQVLTEPRTQYYIHAFGDSRGDKEMLNYADEANYKPFR